VIGLVLDASLTLSWCFEDEAGSAEWDPLGRVEREGAIVPCTWPVEVANGLARAERRLRIMPAKADKFWHVLDDLTIGVDETTHRRAFNAVLRIARSGRVTAHDACYIALAQRAKLPLATVDGGMRRAAGALGIGLLP
jgi:predicted nucleic acid-binding protein